MKVRHFLLTKNLGQKKGVNCFCLMSHLVAPKILNKKKMNVRHFVLPKILDKIKIKVRHIFAYQKSWTKKKVKFLGFMSHLVPEKILNKKKNECEAFFYRKFWTKKKWTWGIFLLNAPTSHQNNPGEKNEGATFFCLPKILGKEGKDLGTKKGWFFFA